MLLNVCKSRLLRSTKKLKGADSGRQGWPLTKQISKQDLEVLRYSLKKQEKKSNSTTFPPNAAYPAAQLMLVPMPARAAAPPPSIPGALL